MNYKCPQCGMTSGEPGMCPHCNVEMQPVAEEAAGPQQPPADAGMPPQA